MTQENATADKAETRDLNALYDPENSATKVIKKFGTNAAFARAIGRQSSTTTRWLQNGFIPGHYLADVCKAARVMGITLTAEDFIDLRLLEAA